MIQLKVIKTNDFFECLPYILAYKPRFLGFFLIKNCVGLQIKDYIFEGKVRNCVKYATFEVFLKKIISKLKWFINFGKNFKVYYNSVWIFFK